MGFTFRGTLVLVALLSAPATDVHAQASQADEHAALSISLRSFWLSLDDGRKRHAWTENLQVNYESGFTPGAVGFGFDVSPFAALKIERSGNAGNMVHVGADGHERAGRAWAYLGRYDLKVRSGATLVKLGLQQVTNPLLESADDRGLPPTFRGVALVTRFTPTLTFEAGSFDAVMARGHSELQPLTTGYGGVAFPRVSFAGGHWGPNEDGGVSVYVDRADDVWTQAYLGVVQSAGDPARARWTGKLNLYATRDQGRRLQGTIDNLAYSLSLSASRGPFSAALSYQRNLGDQFFDYIAETAGIVLANSGLSDFVAPQERSVQVKGVLDAGPLGWPGFKLTVWATRGRRADAGHGAALHAAPDSLLHTLYWKNGEPVHGGHHEFGVYPSYVVPDGRHKGTRFAFIAAAHRSSPFYADDDLREYKITIDMPSTALQ